MKPADIAVVRALLAVARERGAMTRNTRIEGQILARIWRVGDLTIVVKHQKRNWLAVLHASGHARMDAPITSAQQVADLLHAVGLAPVELTSGWKAAAEEISDRCLERRDSWSNRLVGAPRAYEESAHIAREVGKGRPRWWATDNTAEESR